jgi:hypothetical protein
MESDLSTLPHDTKKSVPGRARVAGKNGGVLYPFEKGHGQTPGYNKPAYLKESLRLAREASPRAVATLIKHLDAEDGRIAVVAAERLLERAWGPARHTPDERQEVKIDLSRLTSAELHVLLALVERGGLQPLPEPGEAGPQEIEGQTSS